MTDIPHLAWPFRRPQARGPLAQVEQGLIDDVRQNVRSYFNTVRGERPLSPDFGLEDPTFGPGVDPILLAADIEETEPGAAVTITVTSVDATGRQKVDVFVELAEGT